MQTFRKNQIIITALVVLIAIAGYLNFTDRNDPEELSVFNIENEQDSSDSVETAADPGALVPNEGADVADADEQDEPADEQDEPEDTDTPDESTETIATDTETDETAGEAIFVSFFIDAKIKREQDRAGYKADLFTAINDSNLPDESRDTALKEMIDLHDIIEKEAVCESLLEAKGFKDVYVRITNDQVDVVINATDLSEQDLAQIEDIVVRKTGLPAENIVISYYKPEK